jgi:hypothetical protein
MRRFNLFMIVALASLMILGSVMTAAASPVRIVVLPFYVEEGVDASKGGVLKTHYRRTMRQINNHLDRNDFEVINPFAKENIEKEYDHVAERAREDSVLAVREVCEKYGVDVAYIVWLNVKMRKTADGYYKATAIIDGEGYDAGGRDLGVGLTETYKVTRRDRDEAVVEVEKYAGDVVGQMLTTWRHKRGDQYAVTTTSASSSSPSEGRLMQNSRKHENTLQVRLDGATDYEIAEVFGKVLNTATGVVDAKRVGGSIVRNNPQASYAAWRVEIDGEITESFRLEANIMKMIHDVMESGGNLELKGVPYRYSQDEIRQLQGVHPGKSNSRQLQFVVDRSETIEREMTGKKGFN